MDINYLAPNPDLYRLVRAGFIAQGTTLSGWCQERGVDTSNARSALAGAWNGPKGKALREQLIEASGIGQPYKLFATHQRA